MNLSDKQKSLLSDIQFAGKEGCRIETGRYKNSLMTLKSLINKNLVHVEPPIRIGENNFLCKYIGPNPIHTIYLKAKELGFNLNETDCHEIWMALKDQKLTNDSLF